MNGTGCSGEITRIVKKAAEAMDAPLLESALPVSAKWSTAAAVGISMGISVHGLNLAAVLVAVVCCWCVPEAMDAPLLESTVLR
jgi:hypothetical protein